MNRTDEGVGGSHRGIPGLWAALVLVGLAVWKLQIASLEGGDRRRDLPTRPHTPLGPQRFPASVFP
jgi:hypothetical protein